MKHLLAGIALALILTTGVTAVAAPPPPRSNEPPVAVGQPTHIDTVDPRAINAAPLPYHWDPPTIILNPNGDGYLVVNSGNPDAGPPFTSFDDFGRINPDWERAHGLRP